MAPYVIMVEEAFESNSWTAFFRESVLVKVPGGCEGGESGDDGGNGGDGGGGGGGCGSGGGASAAPSSSLADTPPLLLSDDCLPG